jgi:tetratricopeptide (TPR) repeat protein
VLRGVSIFPRARFCAVSVLLLVLAFFGLLALAPSVLFAQASIDDHMDSYHYYSEAKYQTAYRQDYTKAVELVTKSLEKNPSNQQASTLKEWLDKKMLEISTKRAKELENEKLKLESEEAALKAKETKEVETKGSSEVDLMVENFHLYQGRALLEKNDYDAAIIEFKEDLKTHPDRLEDRFFIAKYEMDQGRIGNGLELLDDFSTRLLAAGNKEVDLSIMALDQIELYQQMFLIQRAIDMFNKRQFINSEMKSYFPWENVRMLPATSEVIVELPMIKKLSKKILQILKLRGFLPASFDADADNFEMGEDGRVALKRSAFRKRHQIYFESLVKKRSYEYKDFEKHMRLGDYYSSMGLYNRAEVEYKYALEFQPDSPILHNNLGAIYRITGRTRQAIESTKRAISLDNTYAEAYNNLGLLYHDQGSDFEALKLFKMALKLSPTDAQVFMNMGLAFEGLGQSALAIDAINKAIVLQPNVPDYHYRLGYLYYKSKNAKMAIKHFRKVLTLVDQKSDVAKDIKSLLLALSR